MYALANKHYDIVEWLETQGAIKKQWQGKLPDSYEEARKAIAFQYDAWID